MKKKVLSCFLIMAMLISLMPIVSPKVSANEDKPDVSKEYVPPKYEEGKINVNGYYTVGNDGQLMADIEWTYPYRNPLTDSGVDPSRPYRYKMWQAKKLNDGSWSEWDTRSPVDVDKADGRIRVLNVAPNSASTAYLRNWMNMAAEDYDGSSTTVGRGIIKVYPVVISDYNKPGEAERILKTDPDTGELTNSYQYSVIMFGTYDANDSMDLTADSQKATEDFSEAGGGLMFGHDTLTGWTGGVGVRTYFSRFAQPDYLDITMRDEATTLLSTYVKVVDTGFLTSRPWNLEGKTLTIPQTHMLGQKVTSSNASRVWMQFSNAAGVPLGTSVDAANQTGAEIDNYYLVTNGSNAMIQTGHTSGAATEDEAKVFANTLIYLAQSTTTTTARDSSFIDEAAPTNPEGKVASIVPTEDLTHYNATVELTGSEDRGTEYAYKIQAIPQTTLDDMSNYKEIWSTKATNPEDDSVFRNTATSGLKGYYVKAVNTNSTAETADSRTALANLLPGTGDVLSYEAKNLTPGVTYYVHAYAVDWAGNLSGDLLLPISVSARTATFHNNDGTDDETKTLLTSIDTLSSMPGDLSREGYKFLGWYENEEGKGDRVTSETTFDEATYGDEIDLYAKWVKIYPVTIGQRGEGSVTISGTEDEESPFQEGSDVTVNYSAAKGYKVSGVWLDDVFYKPDKSGKLVIDNIHEEHYVLVEFISDEEDSDYTGNEVYYSVDTKLSGGGAKSKITPSVRLIKNDARTKNYTVSWDVADGYQVKGVKVDGIVREDLLKNDKVIFSKVAQNHSVEVEIVKEESVTKEDKYNVITKLVGGPGSITPSSEVKAGSDYNINASVSDSKNYEIKSIVVHDSEGNVVNKFATNSTATSAGASLTGIDQDYEVIVTLASKQQAGTVVIPEKDLLRINTSIIGEGNITESKILQRGDDSSVEWSAAEGWHVREIIIDGDRIYYPERKEETAISLMSLDMAGDEGDYLFEQIEKDHSVQVILEKDTEEKKDGVFSVQTFILGDANATITAGNNALEEGEDYPVSWSVTKDYTVTDVLINGISHPELLNANKYNISSISEDYIIEVVVKRVLNIDTNDDGKPDVNIDTDGDGKPDVNVDTDGDGKPDINVDTDGDGKPDVNIDTDGDDKPDINIDTDGDGKPDVNIDTDGDGKPDVNVDTDGDDKPDVNIDTDGDGKPDINIDTNGDGKPNINIDTDGDGKANLNVDVDGDGRPDVNIDINGDGIADINIDADGDGIPDAIQFDGPKTSDGIASVMWMAIMAMIASAAFMVLLTVRYNYKKR